MSMRPDSNDQAFQCVHTATVERVHGDVNVYSQKLVGAGVDEELVMALGDQVVLELAKEKNHHQQAAYN